MRQFLALAVIAAVVIAAACAQNSGPSDGERTVTRGARPGGAGQPGTPSSLPGKMPVQPSAQDPQMPASTNGQLPEWGIVIPGIDQTIQTTNRNDTVRAFVSMNLDPSQVGATTSDPDPNPCSAGMQCGVAFGFRTQNDVLSPLTFSNNLTLAQAIRSSTAVGINGGGNITFAIYDSFSQDQGPIGGAVALASSSYLWTQNGVASVEIYFADNYGWVYVKGSVDPNANVFSGNIYFYNRSTKGPSNWANTSIAPQLGTFKIPACSAFRCQ